MCHHCTANISMFKSSNIHSKMFPITSNNPSPWAYTLTRPDIPCSLTLLHLSLAIQGPSHTLLFCAFSALADITPSTDDLAGDKNATAECRDEKFACTRLYSVHRPVRQCVHQSCFTSLRRMYIINNEICSRLVCKEHEAMKDELCRQMAGLPPRRLRRSNYFRLPPCENMNLQRPDGL